MTRVTDLKVKRHVDGWCNSRRQRTNPLEKKNSTRDFELASSVSNECIRSTAGNKSWRSAMSAKWHGTAFSMQRYT